MNRAACRIGSTSHSSPCMTPRALMACVVLASVTGIAMPAMAALDGATSCERDEVFVVRHKMVDVYPYVAGAQRGDILLTSGGDGVPKALFNALGQTYNHTMLVSVADGSHGTKITHETGISPGFRSMELLNLNTVRWKPEHLRRFAPGNVIADEARALLRGVDKGCLNREGDMQDCLEARPVNLWRTTNLLIRPNPAYLSQTAIVDHAETIPEHSLLYAFGAYSDHLGAYNGANAEAAYGRGSMCSGFVTESLNVALSNAGHASMRVQPVLYSNAQRFTAALALHNKIFTLFTSEFTDEDGNYTLGSFTTLALNVVHVFANQIVNCFAHGGTCDNLNNWSVVSPVSYLQSTPAPAPGQLYPTQSNGLGIGYSVSGDDLLDDALAHGWATATATSVMGDYSYQVIDRTECCIVDGMTGEFSSCRPSGRREATRDKGGLGETIEPPATGGGDEEVALDEATQAEIERFSEALRSLDGRYIETEDAYCYVTAQGALCNDLPAEESEEELAKEDEVAFSEEVIAEVNTSTVTRSSASTTLSR